MKKVNFKNSVIALAIGLVMVSCGGGNSSKQCTAETQTEQAVPAKGTELKNVDENNWQAVVKANFGIDLAVPVGWSLKSVKSPNGVNNLIVVMTINEGTTGEEEGNRLFEATKAISKHGNFKNKVDWDAETVSEGNVVNDFSEVDQFNDSDVLATWNFTFDSKMIMVNYTVRNNYVEYMFTINNR